MIRAINLRPWEVAAYRAGKTAFAVPLKPQPTDYAGASRPPSSGVEKKHVAPYLDAYDGGPFWCWWDEYDRQGPDWIKPPYTIGARLYGREAHSIVPATAYRMSAGVQQIVCPRDRDRAAVYREGWERSAPPWRSAAVMPRWASRITLVVTGVRICRLSETTEAEALACGVERDPETGAWWGATGKGVGGRTRRYEPASLALADLMASGKDHGAALHERNPWAALYTTEPHWCNVSEMEAA